MSASDLTKQAIIQSTKKLASEKPFEKISVIQIAAGCSINRNTFYYYFSDKYDVLAWIFHQEVEPLLKPYFETGSLADSVSALCAHMKKEKAFYSRVLADSGSRCLRELLVSYYKGFLIAAATPKFRQHNLESTQQEIAARFYAHGTVGMICDWAAADMKMDSRFATSIIQLSASEKFFV